MVEATWRAQLSSSESGWRGGRPRLGINMAEEEVAALQEVECTLVFLCFLWVDMVPHFQHASPLMSSMKLTELGGE